MQIKPHSQYNEQNVPIANRRWRLIAMLMDIVDLFALAALVRILCAVIDTDITNSIREPPTLLLGTLLYCLYYIPQEALTGTRFTTQTAKPPRQAAIRTLVRLIPGEPLSFVFDEEPAGWHDRAAKTEVVRIR